MGSQILIQITGVKFLRIENCLNLEFVLKLKHVTKLEHSLFFTFGIFRN